MELLFIADTRQDSTTKASYYFNRETTERNHRHTITIAIEEQLPLKYALLSLTVTVTMCMRERERSSVQLLICNSFPHAAFNVQIAFN